MKNNSDKVANKSPQLTGTAYSIPCTGSGTTLDLSWLPATLTGKTASSAVNSDTVDTFHASQTPGTANNIIVAPASGKISVSGGWFNFFESAEQPITSAGSLAIAHGFGDEPKAIQIVLICKTAENGYSIGDKMFMNPGISKHGTLDQGIVIVPDATNLNVRFGANANAFSGLHKTTGASAAPTNANWNLILRAWL